MSSTFDHFKGKVILHAQFTAQEGQASRVQAILKDIQEDVLAGKEPGCLTFRFARDGNEFLAFEEYENAAAVKIHNDGPKFQIFAAAVHSGTLLVGGPKVAFYEEV
ncbi:hypothetical protein FRC09_006471 [Ceratobasidium sp. 395]|nr:hypothetical protein FRC09_006471 [Ceratobasidium sp. 395]